MRSGKDADLFGNVDMPKQKLMRAFGVPPFSILSARDGAWQKRKAWWRSVGITGEVGRDSPVLAVTADRARESYTSVFDCALVETVVGWFSTTGDVVIDPFAGGPPRGIVSAAMGRNYHGIDLRQEQVTANESCLAGMRIDIPGAVTWRVGDSASEARSLPEADMLITCPPYGDLEVYSDDPRDLSAMDSHAFAFAYKRAILGSLSRLRDNRFAVVVVGDYRIKGGALANFPSLTIAAAMDAGASLYNDFVLVTNVNSAAMRAHKQFTHSRKMVRTHQNVLVFVKGDPVAATARLEDASS